jgi:hypothetical protein
MTYAHENPRDGVAHKDDREVPTPFVLIFEEKTDSWRSGFEAPHLGHFIDPLSLEKTMSSNSFLHFEHQNSYSGIYDSLGCVSHNAFQITMTKQVFTTIMINHSSRYCNIFC